MPQDYLKKLITVRFGAFVREGKVFNFLNRRAIIDIDDVLLDLANNLSARMNSIGDYATYNDYLTYDFNRYHNLSHQTMRNIVDEQGVYLDLDPINGSIEALSILSDKGFFLDFVTARGGFLDAEKRTRESLERLNIKYDSLTLIDSRKNKKSDYYRQYKGDLAFIADDAPQNIVDASLSKTGIAAFCIASPWNNTREVHLHSHGRFNSLLELSNKVKIA